MCRNSQRDFGASPVARTRTRPTFHGLRGLGLLSMGGRKIFEAKCLIFGGWFVVLVKTASMRNRHHSHPPENLRTALDDTPTERIYPTS
jgi:hypothetical protein